MPSKTEAIVPAPPRAPSMILAATLALGSTPPVPSRIGSAIPRRIRHRRWVCRLVRPLVPILAVSSPAAAQLPPFAATPVWNSVPAYSTHAVALGDIDNDGDLDLVCGNYNFVNTQYRNDPAGLGGDPVWSSATGNATLAAALGDVDGDGDLDLVCGNDRQPNTLYLNDGTGLANDPAWSSGPGRSTRAVALGDVDGDGDLDLVCGNGSPGQPNALYLNEGGTFATDPAWLSRAANITFAIALGDVDGDGDLDLACGNFGQNSTLYRNDGGTFGLDPVWQSDSADFTYDLALGDVDGDGDLDLACGNWMSQPNTLYLNEGGTFATTPAWSSDATNSTLSVALGDVDGDGDLDLACGNDAAGHNTLYLNDGGVLATAPVWSSAPMSQTEALALGDMDGDGELDLVCGNYNEKNEIYVNYSGPFSPIAGWSSSAGDQTEAVVLGDVDGDGDLDLVCGNDSQQNTLHINHDGSFEPTPAWSSGPTNATYALALGDVDGDLDLDLVCGNYGQGNTLYRNDGGVFTTTPDWISEAVRWTRAVALGDVDGDGDLDLVCGNYPQGNELYLGEGGRFGSLPAWTSDYALLTRAVVLGDIDGDGDLDLVCGNYLQKNTLYINEGGTFSTEPAWFSLVENQTDAMDLGDIDGDGDLDLACGNYDQRNAVYLNENGMLSATPAWLSGLPLRTTSVALRDVDGDGDLDLVCGNAGQKDRVYLNEGGVLATTEAWLSASAETQAVALGDLDGDGDLDLVCGNRGEPDTIEFGLKGPAYKGDPTSPANHLPNNPAHLRWATVSRSEGDPNLRTVEFTAIDVESDPVLVVAEYRGTGEGSWTHAVIEGSRAPIGPLGSSPEGVVHRLSWDVSTLPVDSRDVALRLRAISHPTRVSLVQQIASYNLEIGRIVPRRPAIRSSVDHLSFPTVTVGDTVSVKLALSNDGSEPLRIDGAALRLSRPFPFEIAPAATESLSVFLEPVTDQGIAEDLRIMSNDPTAGTLSIPITTDIRELQVETIALVAGEEAPLGEALIVQVIPADLVHVETGTLFHRPATGGNFALAELVPIGGAFVGIVPRTSVTEVGLEYYVQVENSGIFAVDPPGAPGDSLFHQAVASPEAVTATAQAGSGGRFLTGQGIPVVVRLDPGVVFEEGSLHYRRAGERDYQTAPLAVIESDVAASIPADFVEARGVEYWVELATRTNPRITDPGTDPAAAPRTIRTSVLAEEEESSSPGLRYRMLSIPLEFDSEFDGTLEDLLRDEDEFGEPDPAKWRVFRYLPSSGTVELADDCRFRPEPGWAFWLISRSEHRIDSAPIEALSIRSDQEYRIVLDPGWNQLGSPFDFPVAWGSIRISSDAVGAPVGFDPSRGAAGEYTEPATVLVPFQGYFVRNASSQPETLWVPPVEAAEDTARAAPAPVASSAWSLRLEAASPGAQPGTITLGAHPSASDELDELDWELPPDAPGSWVRLAVDNRGWRTRPGRYRRDIRRVDAEGHRWPVEVRTNRDAADVTLAAVLEGNLPAGWEIRLLDVEQGVSKRLDSRAPYRLVSFGPGRSYRLAVLAGDAAYLAGASGDLAAVPTVLALDHNAPNPFRSATRIRFGLPRPQRVSLEIYGVEGRRVFTLVDDRLLPAGYHVEVWPGSDRFGRSVASGVYFYRLRTEDGTLNRKMLILR